MYACDSSFIKRESQREREGGEQKIRSNLISKRHYIMVNDLFLSLDGKLRK